MEDHSSVGGFAAHVNQSWQNDTNINLLDDEACLRRYQRIKEAVAEALEPIFENIQLKEAEQLIVDFTFSPYFYVPKIYIQLYHPLLNTIFKDYKKMEMENSDNGKNDKNNKNNKNNKKESNDTSNDSSNDETEFDNGIINSMAKIIELNVSNHKIFIKKKNNYGINNEFFKRLVLGVELPCKPNEQELASMDEKDNSVNSNKMKYGSKIKTWQTNDNPFILRTINECLSKKQGLTKDKPIKLMICDELAFIFQNYNDLKTLFAKGYVLFECKSYQDLTIMNRFWQYKEMIESHFGFINMLKVLRKSGDTDNVYVDLYYAMTFLDWSELNIMLCHFESKKYAWQVLPKSVDYHNYIKPKIQQRLDGLNIDPSS